MLMAAGGAGQVYSDTTNPAVATGDGIALAAEAGAELADMEFYQFHPTALSLPGAPRFLLSEALRGEGAYLRNDRGERFMERYHPSLELAPRDVVARAVAREGMSEGGGEPRPVYPRYAPCARPRSASALSGHQRVSRGARTRSPPRPDSGSPRGPLPDGRHPHRSRRPHHACAGSMPRARRRAPACMEPIGWLRILCSKGWCSGRAPPGRWSRMPIRLSQSRHSAASPVQLSTVDEEHVDNTIACLQRSMWEFAGLLREKTTLLRGLETLSNCTAELSRIAGEGKTSRRLSEARALCRVADAILRSALARTESRGAHYRNDYPQRDDAQFLKHSIFGRDQQVVFEQW